MTTKIKEFLLLTGYIGAIISAIAYIVFTIVLIFGFNNQMDGYQQTLFSIVGAFAGLMITIMLREQGIMIAKNEDEPKKVMSEYHKTINKVKPIKQLHTITYYRTINLIKDIFTRLLTMSAMTYFVLYIFLEGSGDYGLLGLAIANISMFVSFGLIGMSSSYDFYLNEHIPAIKEIIQKLNDQARSVELEREKHDNVRASEILITTSTSIQKQNGYPGITGESTGYIKLNS